MNVRKNFEFIANEFVHGGHLQSLGASSIVYVSAVFLNIELKWSSLVVAYLLFYPLYLYNRWKEIEIDYATNPDRTMHLRKYIHIMPIIFCLVIAAIVGLLAYFGNLSSFIFGLILLVLGLLYTTIFKNVTQKIFLFKNIYVSAFFTALVFFTAVFHSFSISGQSVVVIIVLMAFVFLKSFMMQIFLDLKDLVCDRKQRLKTLGVIIGEKKTFQILPIISIITTAPIIIFFSLYIHLFPSLILFLLLTIPFDFFTFKIVQDKNYFGYILGSGQFVLWAILVLIGENLI
ncbi:UbiA family prenyltransferase [Patescibacteria group bacterium]|nr:UbiA family prenyltransferase [Patescibacteria group bacterium]